jgi:hypothetical protein
MGIEDLLDGFGRHYRKRDDYSYNDDDYGSRRTFDQGRYNGDKHHGHGGSAMYLNYARKILRNKKLLAFLIIAAILALIIAILIGIWLLSLVGPALGLLEKNGIKGIVDALMPFLQKLWEGSGK